MTYDVDAIYDQGMFRPLEPLVLPDGARVHLHVEEERPSGDAPVSARIHSPRLAHPEQAREFEMDVREISDADI